MGASCTSSPLPPNPLFQRPLSQFAPAPKCSVEAAQTPNWPVVVCALSSKVAMGAPRSHCLSALSIAQRPGPLPFQTTQNPPPPKATLCPLNACQMRGFKPRQRSRDSISKRGFEKPRPGRPCVASPYLQPPCTRHTRIKCRAYFSSSSPRAASPNSCAPLAFAPCVTGNLVG